MNAATPSQAMALKVHYGVRLRTSGTVHTDIRRYAAESTTGEILPARHGARGWINTKLPDGLLGRLAHHVRRNGEQHGTRLVAHNDENPSTWIASCKTHPLPFRKLFHLSFSIPFL